MSTSPSPQRNDTYKTFAQNKVLDHSELAVLRDRFPGKVLVHCHGVFDLLHPGHLAYFKSAKALGDILIVTVTTDSFVNKGPGRPHFSTPVRMQMLAALEIIDFVAESPFASAAPAIEAIKPHYYVKGPDYNDMSKDVTGAIYQEEQTVKSHGGSLVFTQDETHSSSNLINKYFHAWTKEQQRAIELVQKAGGIDKISEVLDAVAKERVLVIGEPIVDTYIFCYPESISSKGASVSARYLYEEDYAGGSLANVNHLADFAESVTLLTTHGGENYFLNLLEQKLDNRVELVSHPLRDIPTPKKARYIGLDQIQRIFEITWIRNDQWNLHNSDQFCREIDQCSKNKTTTIIADFGHGMLEGPVLERVRKQPGFVGLNVQTNSSNIGFNFISKYQDFSYLSIDTKEARLAYRDRLSTPLELCRKIRKDHPNRPFAMTLGHKGSCYLPGQSDEEILVPAFDDEILDAVGAGDAYFALTTLLVKVGCPDIMIPFIGNVFAGLKTKIVGNKVSVSRAQLIKALQSILK